MWTVFTKPTNRKPFAHYVWEQTAQAERILGKEYRNWYPNSTKWFTASTENALYYVGKTDLKTKLILIEDMDGANSVLYVLRELQSKRVCKQNRLPMKDSKAI